MMTSEPAPSDQRLLSLPQTGLQLRSLLTADGTLELYLIETPTPEPKDEEVVIEVRAAPMNPSDLALLLASADVSSAQPSGTPARPKLTLRVPAPAMSVMRARFGLPMPAGNEGAGLVVAAGASPQAQALLGRTVAVLAGAMYGRYRALRAQDCLVLPDGVTAAAGASAFVNPLTALGMIETMRTEGHTALVHTAAASNLGQMLARICVADGVDLVAVVRTTEQVDILRAIGLKHICDSSAAGFEAALTDAVKATGATLGFDATAGGPLAGQILTAMEIAASARSSDYTTYGSTVHKQVYVYGGLNPGPTAIDQTLGRNWGLGGWHLSSFMKRTPPDRMAGLKARVAAELGSMFASHYTRTISLTEMLQPEIAAAYARRATGEKFLVDPSRP